MCMFISCLSLYLSQWKLVAKFITFLFHVHAYLVPLPLSFTMKAGCSVYYIHFSIMCMLIVPLPLSSQWKLVAKFITFFYHVHVYLAPLPPSFTMKAGCSVYYISLSCACLSRASPSIFQNESWLLSLLHCSIMCMFILRLFLYLSQWKLVAKFITLFFHVHVYLVPLPLSFSMKAGC